MPSVIGILKYEHPCGHMVLLALITLKYAEDDCSFVFSL